MKIIHFGLLSLILLSFNLSLAASEEDTTKLKVGNTSILIIENPQDSLDKDSIKITKKKDQRFNKFAGVDIGVNGLLSKNQTIRLPENAENFELNYAKSISVGINPFEKYFPIVSEKFGITTGLGFQFNSYDIKRDLVFITTDDTIYGRIDSSRSIEKTRLKTSYLQLPLLLETNLGKSAKKSFHLAAGMLFGYRIGSKIKQIYEQDGREYKIKDRGDLNLQPFRASVTARVGYGNFTIYANYSLTPLFSDGKGPEMYPFTLGVSLLSF